LNRVHNHTLLSGGCSLAGAGREAVRCCQGSLLAQV